MASQYTDRQRTRVFTRDTQNTASSNQKAIGQTQLMTIEKEGLFDGISLAQIIAGAAAAATSMVLASKIGIGGSVIGAAVSSVVTVVSSQLYRKFLTASAQKLKGGKDALGDVANSLRQPSHDANATIRYSGHGDASLYGNGEHATGGQRRGARIAPASLQAKAAAERQHAQHKVMLFSIGIAIVAVVLSAAAIFALTAGEGLGEKTEPIIFSAPASDPSEGKQETTSPDSEDAPAAQTDNSANTNASTPNQGTQTNPSADVTTEQPGTSDATENTGDNSGSATGDTAEDTQRPSGNSDSATPGDATSNTGDSTSSTTSNTSSSAA